MAWCNVPFISPFAYGSSQATPTNTTPTRRFGTGIQATTFKGDPATTALRANAGRTTFAVDESSQVFGSPRRATVFRGDDDE